MANLCALCKNKDQEISATCRAFPNGIPSFILDGSVKHTSKLKDQNNNIVYEEKIIKNVKSV
jgi:hypothetical protein